MLPFDFAERIKPGWTKKELIGLLEDARKTELLHIRARADVLEMARTKFKNAAMTAISIIPSELRDKPYFECLDILQNDKNVFLSNLVTEAKKRSRMEWEDSVKTRTGKRPCRTQNSKTTKVQRNKLKGMLAESLSHIFEDDDVTTMSPTVKVDKIKSHLADKTSILSNIKPAVASTPKFVEPNSIAVPLTRHQTRSRITGATTTRRVAATSRLAAITQDENRNSKQKLQNQERIFLPEDDLQTTHGTPIRNPFNLINSKSLSNLSSPDIRNLRSIMNTIQSVLDRKENKAH